MSNCKGCKGNCETNKTKITTSPRSHFLKKEDISNYLRPKKVYGPEPDASPLDSYCGHWHYGKKMRRYQCLDCIKSWVYAVGIKEAERVCEEYKSNVITSDRIKMVLKEYKSRIPMKQLEKEMEE